MGIHDKNEHGYSDYDLHMARLKLFDRLSADEIDIPEFLAQEYAIVYLRMLFTDLSPEDQADAIKICQGIMDEAKTD